METLGHQKREYISALPRTLRALVRTDIYSRFWRPNISVAHRAECICIYILQYLCIPPHSLMETVTSRDHFENIKLCCFWLLRLALWCNSTKWIGKTFDMGRGEAMSFHKICRTSTNPDVIDVSMFYHLRVRRSLLTALKCITISPFRGIMKIRFAVTLKPSRF